MAKRDRPARTHRPPARRKLDARVAERHEQGEVERDGFMLRELRYGTFSRSLPLAAGVTAASITATYKDGLLEVRIPTAAATPAPPPARIPITTS
jgi:HSP20 family protein